jgi:hypothetical protein
MTTTNIKSARKAITPISPIETIREQLLQLKPKAAHDKERMFAGLYEDIRRMLDEKVTQRDILQLLAEHGLKLSPTRFKELMQKHSGEPASNSPRVKSSPSNTPAIKSAPTISSEDSSSVTDDPSRHPMEELA